MSKCPICNKTAYPLESQKVGEILYHKLCFKCEECRQQLSLTTFQPHSETGKVYCPKCVPKPKNLQAAETMEMSRVKDGPKLDTVNPQMRGGEEMRHNLQATETVQLQRAREGPKLETVNQQVRGDGAQTNLQSAETMSLQRAKEAPKIDVVNQQVRGDGAQTNLQTAESIAYSQAKSAPKLDVVNQQVRGDGAQSNLQSAESVQMQTAKSAPKLDVVGKRDTNLGSPSAEPTRFQSHATDAPKLEVEHGVQKGTGEKASFNVII